MRPPVIVSSDEILQTNRRRHCHQMRHYKLRAIVIVSLISVISLHFCHLAVCYLICTIKLSCLECCERWLCSVTVLMELTRIRFPANAETRLFSVASRLSLGTPNLLSSGRRWDFRVRRPGRGLTSHVHEVRRSRLHVCASS